VCKTNPKKFWNYVNSKSKRREYIGDLVSMDKNGVETRVSTDGEKADTLCDYFTSVFNTETDDDIVRFMRTSDDFVPVMGDIKIDIKEVKAKLNKLNINKSQGPDMLHPRILKEIGDEISYPLKLLFECSLRTSSLPSDWKSANISAIYKKGKNVYSR